MYSLKLKPITDVDNTIDREKTFEDAVRDATNVIFNSKIPKFEYEGEEMFRSPHQMNKIRNKVSEERNNNRSSKYYERQLKNLKLIRRKETGFEKITETVRSEKAVEMSKYRNNDFSNKNDKNSKKTLQTKEENDGDHRFNHKFYKKLKSLENHSEKTELTEKNYKKKFHKESNFKNKVDRFDKPTHRLSKFENDADSQTEGRKKRDKVYRHDGTQIKRVKFRNSSNRNNSSNDENNRNTGRFHHNGQGYEKGSRLSSDTDRKNGYKNDNKSQYRASEDFTKFSNFKKHSVHGKNQANRKVYENTRGKFQKKGTNRPGKARRAEKRDKIRKQVAHA